MPVSHTRLSHTLLGLCQDATPEELYRERPLALEKTV